jgi:hypothetical protein
MDSPRGEAICDWRKDDGDSRGVPAAVEGFCYRDSYEYKGELLKTSSPAVFDVPEEEDFPCGAIV